MPIFVGGLLIGDSDGYELINKPSTLEIKHVSIGTLLGNTEAGSFTMDFEGKANY